MTKSSLLAALLLGLAGCAAGAGDAGDAGGANSDGGLSADAGSGDAGNGDAGTGDAGSPDGGCAANGDCASGSYCAGDGCGTEGSCMPMPASCPPFVQLVCGCDGMTYDNACRASIAGVRVSVVGPCPTAQCTADLQQIQTLVAQTQACATDDDCTIDRVPCGVGPCWASLNTASDSNLGPLASAYADQDHCGAGVACACTTPPASATCDGGICAPRAPH